MSLDWNLGSIKDWETTCFDTQKEKPEAFDENRDRWHYNEEKGEYSRLKAKTHHLIWSGLVTYVGKITKTNWEECYHRIAIYELVTGCFCKKAIIRRGKEVWVDDPFTPEDVYKHIGYHSNTFGKKADWNKALKNLMDNHTRPNIQEFKTKLERAGK